MFSFLFNQLFFVTHSDLLKHLISFFNILFPLLHLLLLLKKCHWKLLFRCCYFSCFFSLKQGVFLLQLLWLSSVLWNFISCQLSPFLQKLYIVFLRLLLNKLIVCIHLTHQINMTLVHFFHVLFDSIYVLSCEL